jgi:branched-chain amino acid transport system permease protein
VDLRFSLVAMIALYLFLREDADRPGAAGHGDQPDGAQLCGIPVSWAGQLSFAIGRVQRASRVCCWLRW